MFRLGYNLMLMLFVTWHLKWLLVSCELENWRRESHNNSPGARRQGEAKGRKVATCELRIGELEKRVAALEIGVWRIEKSRERLMHRQGSWASYESVRLIKTLKAKSHRCIWAGEVP